MICEYTHLFKKKKKKKKALRKFGYQMRFMRATGNILFLLFDLIIIMIKLDHSLLSFFYAEVPSSKKRKETRTPQHSCARMLKNAVDWTKKQ